jgi:hypothetical protein
LSPSSRYFGAGGWLSSWSLSAAQMKLLAFVGSPAPLYQSFARLLGPEKAALLGTRAAS